MANYETLKAAIQAVIKTNGNQTITGAVMQSALISMINGLGANMQFAGIAIPSTSPGTPDGPTFYLAFQNGTYFNFDRTSVYEKPRVFMWGRPGGPEGAWESIELSVPTTAKYNTDRRLEQDRVNAALAAKANSEDVNTALAAKANSEDVNNEFTKVRSDLSQKSSMFTGAIMGKGVFYSTDEPLLFKGDKTVRIVFKTSSDVENPQQVFRDIANNNGLSAAISSKKLSVRSNGSEYITYPVLPNCLYELIIVKVGDGCLLSLNGEIKAPDCPNEGEDATMFRIGAETNNTYKLQATVISAQMFNFAFSRDNITDSWNGGHPESWRSPDEWRNVPALTWPTSSQTPESGTWARSSSNVAVENDIQTANGFSGNFQRFTNTDETGVPAIYLLTRNAKISPMVIEFEYRANGGLVAYDAVSGYSGFKTFPATGDIAQKAVLYTHAGAVISLRGIGNKNQQLEIRTLSIKTCECICDLIPASLTPTVWKDISGQGNDIPYVPFSGNPAECEMAYELQESGEDEYKKSPLYGQQTAALVGGYAGYFKSENTALILPDQPMTVVVCFKVPKTETGIVYDEHMNTGGAYIYVSSRQVIVLMRGTKITSYNVPANTHLCMVALSYSPGASVICRINEVVKVLDEAPVYQNPYTPQHVRLGGWSTSYEEVTIISVRRFDFAMTKEQLEEAWNGGHPERWKVPDAFLTIGRSWSDDSTGSTYAVSDAKMEASHNISVDNGFSVIYQRFGIGTASRIAIYNSFLNNLHRSELKRAWRTEFEYRADAEVILVSNGTGEEPDLRLEANTGDAKRVVFTSLPGKQIALRSNGTYLEIATVKMEQVRAILDLNPQGLTPTAWHDMSSGHNDLVFYPMSDDSNNAKVCGLSYEEHGFIDTIVGDKAPDIYPQFTGQNYIDRTNETMYKAVGTSAASKWKPL